MKKFLTVLIVVVLVGLGIYFIVHNQSPIVSTPAADSTANTPKSPAPSNTQTGTPPSATVATEGASVVIGKSVEGRDIAAYNYGQGDTKIVFIAGAHGGYEWNTSLLAYQLMDYLQANPSAIPANEKVTVIPVLNPDGLNKVVGTTAKFSASDVSSSQTVQVSGRYNGNQVDLNRNFDCDWQASAKWQNTTVSGGTAAFSEPESLAIKNYIESHNPTAIVAFYSAAGGVYASNCHTGVSTSTAAMTKTYADASGYPAYQTFDFYATTGDMTNWLSKIGIPAISVLLTSHTDTEWTKNQKGINALLQSYAK